MKPKKTQSMVSKRRDEILNILKNNKTVKNEEKIQEHDFRIDILESVVKDRIYKKMK